MNKIDVLITRKFERPGDKYRLFYLHISGNKKSSAAINATQRAIKMMISIVVFFMVICFFG